MGHTINALEWLYKKATGLAIQNDITYDIDKNRNIGFLMYFIEIQLLGKF